MTEAEAGHCWSKLRHWQAGLAFGIATAACQVALLGVVFAGFGALASVTAFLRTFLPSGVGLLLIPLVLVAYCVAIYLPPVWIHRWCADHGLAPRATSVTTVVMTGIGMVVGQLIGSFCFERGHLGGGWPSVVSALVGGAVLASVAYLVGPSPASQPWLDLRSRTP